MKREKTFPIRCLLSSAFLELPLYSQDLMGDDEAQYSVRLTLQSRQVPVIPHTLPRVCLIPPSGSLSAIMFSSLAGLRVYQEKCVRKM